MGFAPLNPSYLGGPNIPPFAPQTWGFSLKRAGSPVTPDLGRTPVRWKMRPPARVEQALAMQMRRQSRGGVSVESRFAIALASIRVPAWGEFARRAARERALQ